MQAVILAAGMGKRLGPLTWNRTKCMVELHGRTLIERSLDSLVNVGVRRIVLVVGYMAQGVIELLGDEHSGVPITYVHNEHYNTTNNIHSLFLARDFLGEQDTLLLESDLAYDEGILRDLLRHPAPNIAVVDHYRSWMDGTVVTIGPAGSIDRFIPKRDFRGADVDQYYKTVNIYKFSAEYLNSTYIPFLNAYVHAMGTNEYYEQVLRVVTTLERQNLVALPLSGAKWYEIDDLQDLQNAQTVFAEPGTFYQSYHERRGGYWRFPDVADFSTSTNPFFPSPEVVEEMGRSFNTLLQSSPSNDRVNGDLAARVFGCSPGQVIVGTSAEELLNALSGALGEDGSTFGRAVVENPQRLTGDCLSTAEVVHRLEGQAPDSDVLVLDESLLDFAGSDHCVSFLAPETLAKYRQLFVVKDLGEAYGVPGVRLAVLASDDDALLQKVEAKLPRFRTSSLGEFFLQVVGKYAAAHATACSTLRDERLRMMTALAEIPGVTVHPSFASFLLCEITVPLTTAEMLHRLLTRWNVLVDVEDHTLKIHLRSPVENDRLLEALLGVLSSAPGTPAV